MKCPKCGWDDKPISSYKPPKNWKKFMNQTLFKVITKWSKDA